MDDKSETLKLQSQHGEVRSVVLESDSVESPENVREEVRGSVLALAQPEQRYFQDLRKETGETHYSFSRVVELLAEHKLSHGFSPERIDDRISLAMKIPEVREIFDITTPEITDLSETLEVKNDGKVYAIRMDLNKGVDNHKKYVVASLILRGLLNGSLFQKKIDTLIDGGNFNSAKALRFYCERFGMKGMYVMSRLFPEEILTMLRTDEFSIIQAPARYEKRREVEFYEYLFELIKKSDFRKNKYCLWHAKHGGEATKWLGEEIAGTLPELPEFVVSCLGAGSTLEGIQIPIKEHTGCKIVIPEHGKSQLFARLNPNVSHVETAGIPLSHGYKFYEGLPHTVIGPHFDEINPLLSEKAIQQIDQVMVYEDVNWQNIASILMSKGLSVGNSSAANIACAKNIADLGHNVLTIIFEPQRSFYVKS